MAEKLSHCLRPRQNHQSILSLPLIMSYQKPLSTENHEANVNKKLLATNTTTSGSSHQTPLRDVVYEILQHYNATHMATKLMDEWHINPLAMTSPELMLLAIPPQHFAEAFQKIAERWSSSVVINKLHIMKARLQKTTALNISTANALRAIMLSLVQHLGKKREPAWNPMDPDDWLQPQAISQLIMKNVALPIAFAWLTGQRVGDVLRLENKYVQNIPMLNSTAVTFVRGKVTSHRGPFTIHLPMDSIAQKIVMRQRAMRQTSAYLWFQSPRLMESEETKRVAIEERALKKFIPKSDLWAVRRGGLATLALTGKYQSHEIRHLSMHVDDDGLQRYLGAGVLNRSKAQIQTQMIMDLDDLVKVALPIDKPLPASPQTNSSM